MGAPKRTAQEREAQLSVIEQMYNAGFALRDIATRFDLSPRVIRRDLETIDQRYRDADLAERVVGIPRTIAALLFVRRDAFKAWERSKEDRVRHFEVRVGDTIRTTTITERRLPKVEYMRTILRTMRQEAKLRGWCASMKSAQPYPKPPRCKIGKRGLEALANQPADVELMEPTKVKAKPGAA